ncbi:MAG: hypothetical protein AB2A00_02900 [Myxococcota bacterium]
MRANRPSNTSSLVAFIRAIATDGVTTVPGFQDPWPGGCDQLAPRGSRQ